MVNKVSLATSLLLVGIACFAQFRPGRSFSFRPRPVTDTPPHSPSYWWDFRTSDYLELSSGLVNYATNRIDLSTLATNSGAARPEFFSGYSSNWLPAGRIRFSSGDRLLIPTSVTFDRRALSVFVVTRSHKKDRGTFVHAPQSGSSAWALYGWDFGELRVWNSSAAIATSIGYGHGASVQWFIGDSGTSYYGSDWMAKTNASALTAGSATGANIGLWNGGSFPYATDDIQAVLIYTSALSLSQRDDVLNWASTNYYTPKASNLTQLICSGDSRTEGVIDANPQVNPDWDDHAYPHILQILSSNDPPRIVNLGLGGQLIQNNTNATDVNRWLGWSVTRPSTNIVLGFLGHNDINNARTFANLTNDLWCWNRNITSSYPSAIVGHCTLPRSTSFDSSEENVRTNLNAWLLGSESPFAFEIDVSEFSAITNAADTNIWYDGVHPTQLGYYYIADGIRTALISLGYAFGQ